MGGPIANFADLLHMIGPFAHQVGDFLAVGHATQKTGTTVDGPGTRSDHDQPMIGWGLALGSLAILGSRPSACSRANS